MTTTYTEERLRDDLRTLLDYRQQVRDLPPDDIPIDNMKIVIEALLGVVIAVGNDLYIGEAR